MPTYEYECPKGHKTEIQRKVSGPKQISCDAPRCYKMATRKISAPAVIFKGSGFYSTDNRPPNYD